MSFRSASLPLILSCLLAACATPLPNQPSVMVLPGNGKTFEQFQNDNAICKQFAYQQVAGATPQGVAADSGARSAAVGTLLGAAAGAAINGGHGAGVGAGTGLAIGGLAGIDAANFSAMSLQQHYDVGYEQCMYAHGHRIPVYGGFGELTSGYLARDPHPPPPPPPSSPH